MTGGSDFFNGSTSDGRFINLEAASDMGLICSIGSGAVFVIGVATGVSFTIETDAE